MAFEYIPNGEGRTNRTGAILCCQCGVSIAPNAANMCVNCIRSQVDVSEGIPKQITVSWCKNCERYLQPPNAWITAQLESKELLSILLKKLKGLNRVRLIDASFIWTEPHSRRLKIKLTIQKEVFASTILQQVFQVECIVAPMQCQDCTKLMAQDTWKAVVQVRQKNVTHKKTFYYLEQVILKHQAHKDTVNIKEAKDGLDFYFGARNQAQVFLQFLASVVPFKSVSSQQLISSDVKAGTANYHFTLTAEIIPICKNDLVVLPLTLAKSLGNVNPLGVVTNVSGGGFTMVDPRTLQIVDVQNQVYWRSPFDALCEAGGNATALAEYYVLDVEPLQETSKKFLLVDVTVAKCTRSPLHHNNSKGLTEDAFNIDPNITYICRSHLGYILKPGDFVQGFQLSNQNFNSEHFDDYLRASGGNYGSIGGKGYHQMPDVVLIKKVFLSRTAADDEIISMNTPFQVQKKRHWKLKRLETITDRGDEREERRTKKLTELEKRENQWEEFMKELEQDKEMRGMINLYRDSSIPVPQKKNEDDIDLVELLDEMAIDDSADPDSDDNMEE